MKKIAVFFILALFLLPAHAFAQSTAKIIDVRGEVLVKKEAEAEWQKAKINMLLSKDAEVETKSNSQCTLAFDEEIKNILTLKENSHIKIEEVKPGNIFLQEGRVFSLIENLAKQEKFEIRTPTAIAGARGTGWITDFIGGLTSVWCFKGNIYFLVYNEMGEVEKEIIIPHDTGITSDIKNFFQLTDEDYELWDDFMLYIEGLLGAGGEEGGEGTEGAEPGEDIRQEGQEDFRDEGSLERRLEEEGRGRPYQDGKYLIDR